MAKVNSWRNFRDPVSGGSHLVGAIGGVFACYYLIHRSNGVRQIFAFGVFGATLVLLYLASAAYHLLDSSQGLRKVLRRFDHSMIFIFIAGSYTPYCLITLRGPTGNHVLLAIWAFAAAGLFIKLFWLHAPRVLSTLIYLAMGWLILTVIGPLSRGLTANGLHWLVAGGLCYSLGAVVYALKRPDPIPEVFGFHEIWHCFVLAGSFCHFYSIATLVE